MVEGRFSLPPQKLARQLEEAPHIRDGDTGTCRPVCCWGRVTGEVLTSSGLGEVLGCPRWPSCCI